MGVLQIKFSGLFWETSGAQQDQWTEYFFTIAKNKTRSVMKSCSQDKPIFLMKMTNIQVSSLGVAPRAYLLSSQEGISGSNSSGCQYWGWDVVTYMWLPHESRSCYHVARNKIQKCPKTSVSVRVPPLWAPIIKSRTSDLPSFGFFVLSSSIQ